MSDPGEHEPAGPPIGRDRELATLRRALARANASRRQVVFVTGEPGLGKTTLVQHFVEETRAATRTRIGWGQCVELTGGPEAHFPILDALGRLCAQDPSGTVVETLERVAPSWLLQIPALVDAARADSIARRAANGSGDRMLRELAEALEAVAADETLVLVIEDLHWSDFASVDALACLAQRSGPARLLIVGTYRPAGVAREGPLDRIKQGLIARRQATEIPLAPLAPPAEISER